MLNTVFLRTLTGMFSPSVLIRRNLTAENQLIKFDRFRLLLILSFAQEASDCDLKWIL